MSGLELGEGTGLGLSMSHSIVQAHGGDLRVKTEAGKGTTFTIELPRASVEVDAAEKTMDGTRKAPDFALKGSDGKTHKLADYQGKVVVLAWFPKAFTGG